MPSIERIMMVRVPDWPVHAHRLEAEATAAGAHREGSPAPSGNPAPQPAPQPAPLALVSRHLVIACNEAARTEGVRAGLRVREAQSRCPGLVVHPHDPEVDARRFAPVIAALERLVPGVAPLEPGRCAIRARGPARYYGGEAPAAIAVLEALGGLGLPDSRIGIADGRFAAEQAALAGPHDPGIAAPHPGVRIVAPGASAAFLHPLPVERAADTALAALLHGLGIRTLGALAALPEAAVGQRFGAPGVSAHRRAAGAPTTRGAEIQPRAPARDYAAELPFEPPIDTADRLAFACAGLAERFLDGLLRADLVCTALRVELTDDAGGEHTHIWQHPGRFTAADIVNRIRWQAGAMPRDVERAGAGISAVRIAPARTDRVSAHEPGLWQAGASERVHHHATRAQNRLGHAGIGTVQLTGGRLLADRQRFVPWGTADAAPARSAERQRARVGQRGPWPGAIPAPAPSVVFPHPPPAELIDARGRPVLIDGEDLLTADPAHVRFRNRETLPVHGWSLPWPLRERGWAGAPPRFRLQVQLASGDAWLLLHESGRWFAEGRYD